MPTPVARVGDMTVTGDTIIGPGVPTVLFGGMPAAVVGDFVSGPACVGSISQGSPTVLIGGRPAARVSSLVNGIHPGSGASVMTAIGTGDPLSTIP